MSRFWAAASSSEDEHSEDERSVEEATPQFQKPVDRKFAGAFEDSDSDSEDEVRVVKSAKDKAWEGLQDGVTRIRNARRNGDWPLVQDEFGNVNKMLDKSKMLILTFGGIPNFYIKMLMELEDAVVAANKDKEAVKKMKPVVTRALNQMKLQVKKHNDGYKEQIADCRANPAKYADVVPEKEESDEESSDSDSDSDSDSSASAAPVKKPVKKAAAPVKEESDSEDSLFAGEDEGSSSSEEEAELKGRARWLKTTVDTSAKDAKDAKKELKKAAPKSQKVKTYTEVRRAVIRQEDKMTLEELDRKVGDLVSARGRKGTEPKEVLRQLELLTKAARLHGGRKEIPVLMHLISSMFDAQRGIDDYLDHAQWIAAYRCLQRVIALLDADQTIVLTPLDEDAINGAVTNGTVCPVPGSVSTFLTRLQEEYTKSVQHINPHTKEYVDRLAGEEQLVELADAALTYYQRIADNKSGSAVALLIVENVYYKHSSHAIAIRRAHAFSKKYGNYADLHPACRGKPATGTAPTSASATHPAAWSGNPAVPVVNVDVAERIQSLSGYIFLHGDERAKTRALLCTVFHHALHDAYHTARDLLLVSRVGDFIEKTDVRTQILYNRVLVTLGLCAFRLGLFKQAHDCLSGICGSRAKEFLAQGAMRGQERDLEQERLEKRRQMPYHMHVNPDLLECCHLTAAMLLELPLLAKAADQQSGGHVVSKQLRRYLEAYSHQDFCGPPETTREHVLAATKAILEGDWERGYNYLVSMDVWKLLPGDPKGERVKSLLKARIQEEAVRCYLLVNANNYDSISLASLCEMFSMDVVQVKRTVCRMIFAKELSAAWEPSACILLIYRNQPNRLQTAALGIADKISSMLESNERIVDSLAESIYGYKDDWNRDKKGGGQGGNWQQQGGGGQQRARFGGQGQRTQRPTIASKRGDHRNGKQAGSRQGPRNAWNQNQQQQQQQQQSGQGGGGGQSQSNGSGKNYTGNYRKDGNNGTAGGAQSGGGNRRA